MKTVSIILMLATGGLWSAPTGRLEVCPEHPYYFRDGERHVVLVGISDRQLFSVWRNEKGFSWWKYLDDLAAHRINYVRQDVFEWGKLLVPREYPGQFSNPAWPFARTGPGTAIDGKPIFDLTKFDQSYFDLRLKPFLAEAAERGIYVELTLFEGLRSSRAFSESLYAETNNINGLGLKPGGVTSDSALDNRLLIAIQEAYVDKVLAETSKFGNVIYEIANEAGSKRWVGHFIDYIQNHPTHPSRLVSAGEQTSSFDPRTGNNDIVVKHRGAGGPYATNADIGNHRDSLLSFRVGKPVSHNEYFLYANRSTDDVDFPRKMMWADFTAGGHSNFFDFTFWRGTGRTVNDGLPSRSPPPKILNGPKHLLGFLAANKIEFWKMAPHDELASVKSDGESHIFTFAQIGEQYICYILGGGPSAVTLNLPEGRFASRWYDPKSGRLSPPQSQTSETGLAVFQAPQFKQDIVLYVLKSKP
ncbi:MAG: putative collagen-binding domain-containing protein [Planctomycetota bacterium]|jgi:hypothetical protein